jgi:HD-GYP domain-containing protein (c-di-GMP phosphodiesterase class II)
LLTADTKVLQHLKRHPKDGYAKFIDLDDGLEIIPEIVYEHHERVDGNGYPQGIKSLREIVELLALADFFEAITHSRPQRGPVTPHQGIQMLLSKKHEFFSLKISKAFINIFSLFPVFSIIRLNNGEIGQVVKSNPDLIQRPIVKVLLDRYGEPLTSKKEIDLKKEDRLFITKDISDRVFIDSYFAI